jgi:tellurite resistance protein TerC
MNNIYAWVGFNIFVVLMLVLDIKVFQKEAHEIKLKEALGWSVVWIVLALLFSGLIYYEMGRQKTLEFLTGYIIEKSLSVDNLFVFIIIFSFFRIEPKYQHHILFWGIIGALVFRALFIVAGVALINRFHFIIYVFGALLIYTGFKIAFKSNEEMDPSKNFVLRLATKFLPISKDHDGGKFFLKKDGRWYATHLFIVLLVVETTDVVFAVDSIPAILAITTDPFIVYTSNVFAILGLRALYFALAGVMYLFHYLNYGLAIILAFIGAKMMMSHYYKVPTAISLSVVLGVLALSVVASLLFPKKEVEKLEKKVEETLN